MKKIIITVLLLGLIAGGYYVVRTRAHVTLSVLEGEMVTTRRGDLIVPITASGNIRPASVTKIKGEAGGEVVQTPFDVGQMVHKGDLIIRLDKSDEQRNVDRAKADYERASIAKERAEVLLKKSKDVGVRLAEARRDQAEAQKKLAEVDYNRIQELMDLGGGATHPMEVETSEARFHEAEATLKAAQAELDQAKDSAIEMANLDVQTAEESLETAKKTLEDAEERLRETTVLSPIDGMVVARHVQVGEVVQSGTTSFTGGTVLIEIADVSEIYAVVNVDEADIGQVRALAPEWARPGPTARHPASLPADVFDQATRVEVTVESFRDEEKFYGIIERISPQSEFLQAIATFKVWIRIVSDNRDKLVGLLNTQAEAHFTAKSVRDAVLVSYDAIQKDPNGEGFGVYVPVTKPGESRPEPEFRPCKFGVDNGIDVEVIKGLKEGEKVYTKLPRKTRREQEAEERAE